MWNRGNLYVYSGNFDALYRTNTGKDGKACAEGQFLHVSDPSDYEVIIKIKLDKNMCGKMPSKFHCFRQRIVSSR